MKQSSQAIEDFPKLLQGDEDFIQAVTASMGEGLYAVNDQGFVVFINPAAEKIFGYDTGELLGKRMHDVTHYRYPDDSPFPIEQCAGFRVKHSGVALTDYEDVFIRKDGTFFPVIYTATPLMRQGKVSGVVVIFRDISERKKAEEALSESEERFRYIADTAPVMMGMTDCQGQVVYLNKPWLEFVGFNMEQAYGMAWADKIHPEDRSVFLNAYAQAFQVRERFAGEYRLQRADGIYRWFYAVGVPRYSPQGEFMGFIGSSVDITEKKAAEAELSKRENEFQALFDNASDAILVADDVGRYVNANPAACCLLHRNKDEIIGKTIAEMFFPEQTKQFTALWQAFLEEGNQMGELVLPQPGGESIRLEYRAVANFIPGAHLSILRDITERKEFEQQLAQAKEAAEVANHRKSQFLANMSHELRTPLNAVIGYSQMLEKGIAGELSEKQKAYVRNIVVSGKHLLDMVNEILDLTKIESGKTTLNREIIDLAALVAEQQATFEAFAKNHQITLQFHRQPNLQFIEADLTRLKQILLNLLSNAIKFNRQGGRVDVRMFTQGDQWFVCEIADTGIGIPAESLPDLFTEFYQVDNSFSRGHEGTGLGLAVTRRLVELHGGTIAVESQEGAGSTFTFMLPLQ